MLLSSPPVTFAALAEIVHLRAAASCPEGPTAIIATTVAFCPAVEVSGNIGPSNVTLDPAFDLLTRPAQLSRPEIGGNATLAAYNAEGQLLFSLPFSARGTYRLDVPLGAAAAQSIRRLRVVSGSASAERTAIVHAEPNAETIATDDRNVVFAWNAHVFPAVRISTDIDPETTYAAGAGTYEQLTLATAARRLSVDFSDGVRSTKRTFVVFGR